MRTDDGKKKFRRWPPRVKRRRSPDFPPSRAEDTRPDRTSGERVDTPDGKPVMHRKPAESPPRAGEDVRVTFRHRRRAVGDDHDPS